MQVNRIERKWGIKKEAKMRTGLAGTRGMRKERCENVGSLEGLCRRKELTERRVEEEGMWERKGRTRLIRGGRAVVGRGSEKPLREE